jgi:hypothetical protein
MAIKTIDLDSFIAMTRDAKTVLTRNYTVILGTGMTFDAIFKADLVIADTLVHHFIALMYKQMHVILAHPLRIPHSLTTKTDVQFVRRRLCSPNSGNEKTRQYQQQHNTDKS